MDGARIDENQFLLTILILKGLLWVLSVQRLRRFCYSKILEFLYFLFSMHNFNNFK